jgi:hypothetical protein
MFQATYGLYLLGCYQDVVQVYCVIWAGIGCMLNNPVEGGLEGTCLRCRDALIQQRTGSPLPLLNLDIYHPHLCA